MNQAATGRRRSALRDRVVVITGASSGIGRATACAFAAQGARLVLTARGADGLHATIAECTQAGAHALAEPADVTEPGALEAVAWKAIDAFGRIDVWINNAGVGLFGPFAKADAGAHRRVVDTDLIGAMNGAAAVLPHFLRQRSGTLITNASIGAFVPVPFAAAYTAAKFGLRGFMAALRQELADEPGIHVCSVFPSVIDTPGFQHGANVSGAELRPAPPIFPPEKVAEAMVSLALHPRAEVPVGWPSHLARWGYGLAPVATERVVGWGFRRYLRHAAPAADAPGNLFTPSSGRLSASGGIRGARRPPTSTMPWLAIGGLAALGVGLGAAVLARRRRRSEREEELHWAV